MAEYEVGQEITRGDKKVLITRIVNSTAYFEDRETGQAYKLTEHYVETLSKSGEIGFIPLSEERVDVTRNPENTITGPDTLEWRKLNV